MKIAIEIGTLTRVETGIYRYCSNLVRSVKKIDQSAIVTPAIYSGTPGQTPTNPALFSELFGDSRVPFIYRKTDQHGIPTDEVEVRHGGYFHLEYHKNRLLLKRAQSGTPLRCVWWVKLKRECSRSLVAVVNRLQRKSCQPLTPLFGVAPDIDILHTMYDALPENLGKHNALICQTVHDVIPLLFEHSFFRHFPEVMDSARRADLIIVISESTKRDLLRLDGFREENIEVVPLAADPVFQPAEEMAVTAIRDKTGIPSGVPYFLSVSTLEPRKNFPFLLRAFKKMMEQPDATPCRLVLTGAMGWGDAVQEIGSLLKELEGLVHYTGFVSDQELAALYSGASAFLFPSVYEGFGLPALEAMACGTAVISSNTSSMPEVIGESGTLLSPTDEQGWISAMQSTLQQSEEERRHASQTALQQASRFSWGETARLTLAAYQKALARKKGQSVN